MTEQTQIYKGKYADSKPTAEQIALLQKMNVKKEVIEALNRQQAFLLIREIWQKYYEAKFEKQHKPKIELYIRW